MKTLLSRTELAILIVVPVATVFGIMVLGTAGGTPEGVAPFAASAAGLALSAIGGAVAALLWIAARRCHTASRQLRTQKEIEAALRDSEARFRAIYDNAGAGILLASPEGIIMAANAAFCRIVGYDEEELRHIGWQKLIHHDDDLSGSFADHAARPRQADDHSVERCFLSKTGDPVWVRLTMSYAFDDEGRPTLGIAVAEDVTARRRAEETLRNAHDELERRVDLRTRELQDQVAERTRAEIALRESERKFRALIENAQDLITVLDRDGNIRFQSPSVGATLGLNPTQLTGVSCFELMHREDVMRIKEAFYSGIQTPGASSFFRFRARHADGSWHLMEAVAKNLLHDPVVQGVVVNSRDITERQNAEQQTRHLQNELAHVARINTMGEMAAGFAHELNQPLTAIHNYAQGCVRRLRAGQPANDEICAAMELAAEQASRAGEIIRRIRWFIRRDEPELTPVDINQVILDAVELIESEARHAGVVMEIDLADDLPWVTGDTIQLQQMLINLARNSIEAMADHEKGPRGLTIRTMVRGHDRVEVAVRDSGPGIPPEIRDRLFDPFFTTKSEGLGMGLAICRSIIERHDGRLWVEAEEERGTVFRIDLPVFDGILPTDSMPVGADNGADGNDVPSSRAGRSVH